MGDEQPTASGPGLSHGRTGQTCTFHVRMPTITDEKKGKLSMGISGPSKVQLESKHTSDGFDVSYVPLEEGDYQLTIKCDGKHIPGSPFAVAVEKDPSFVPVSHSSNCKVSGPGLKSGLALEPCYFSVDTSQAGHGPLSFSIQGPSQADIGPSDRAKTGFDYQFLPKAPGDYVLHILWGNVDIPGSPFTTKVDRNPGHQGSYGHPEKVIVSGPGIQQGEVNVPVEFFVDVKEAGPGAVGVSVKGPSRAEISFTKGGDNVTKVQYVCTDPGEYDIIVKFSGEPVLGSPFTANIV
eukprot:m.63074 g.63074  ORF g.63074 m.63074 type:complete len:293 (+) comp35140_c0_seq1:60-938(+)